ncbi:hypothetical protein V493_01793 [Pseudogymnoascus sp. VKM F-4281 (FW-2241)]|nr:hypothetical protein V493_01793 [Pseudogymnoascus sp. VKM F-4281 (FW-2241)]
MALLALEQLCLATWSDHTTATLPPISKVALSVPPPQALPPLAAPLVLANPAYPVVMPIPHHPTVSCTDGATTGDDEALYENARLGVNEPTDCRICDVRLEYRMHFQNHAEKAHGTVSQYCN